VHLLIIIVVYFLVVPERIVVALLDATVVILSLNFLQIAVMGISTVMTKSGVVGRTSVLDRLVLHLTVLTLGCLWTASRSNQQGTSLRNLHMWCSIISHQV
jgi:hypothetical protein